MANELSLPYRAVIIETTRGGITIDNKGGSITYHYKPIDKMDPYHNGPLSDMTVIPAYLKSSWIAPTPENVNAIEDAVETLSLN